MSGAGTAGVAGRRAGEGGSARSRSAALLEQVRSTLPAPPVVVVDAGGGTGQVAVPLAEDGYEVTVLDPSAAMLATCAQRAEERGPETGARLRTVQGDAEHAPELLGRAVADAVLCIGVLEVAGEPERALAALASLLRPGGSLSLVVANRAWLVMRAARRGDHAEALRMLDDPVVTGSPLVDRAGAGQATRAWTAPELRRMLERAGLEVTGSYGVRVLGEPPDLDPAGAAAHRDLELRLAALEPYRSVAEFIHLVARPAGGG